MVITELSSRCDSSFVDLSKSIPFKLSHLLCEVSRCTSLSTSITWAELIFFFLLGGSLSAPGAVVCFTLTGSTSFFILATSLDSPRNIKMLGTSKPPWGRSSEKRRLAVFLQWMGPLRLKKSEDAADIFRGTWPTTVLLRTTATVYGSSVFASSRLQSNSSPGSGWVPNTLVDVMASNTSLDLKHLHQNTYTIFRTYTSHLYAELAVRPADQSADYSFHHSQSRYRAMRMCW